VVDRRYINTLYVTSEGSYIHKDGANVVVDVDGAEKMRVPVHMLGSIASFGRISLSPALMGFAFEEGITITHLSESGRFLARIEGPVKGNVLLRRDQFRAHESPETSSKLARSIVIARRRTSGQLFSEHCAIMGPAWTTPPPHLWQQR
jgi:CRISPR-associated protein Cas1